MKLNLKKLKALEVEYAKNPISLSALQSMIDQVVYRQQDPMGWNNTSSYDFAVNSLKELGVIEDEYKDKKDKARQPLNS